ncbi:MAG TPA: twin-arginine translocase TatA/TatE family subunit [Gemmatimonadaceae bacterium]|nr:twin-arginine translocase TatA/TatE family subunit [Gemmatimonadaceae bacterium]
MGLGNIGFTEIMLLLVVVLLLFGAKRIPEIAGSFGKGIKEFKKNMNDVQRDITESVRDDRVAPPAARDSLAPGERPAPRDAASTEERPEPKRLLS